jgi:hypothetical protein
MLTKKKRSNMGVIRYSIYFFIIGVFPIPFLFFVHEELPVSVLTILYEFSEGHARAISDRYIIISTIASSWTLLAPVVGMLAVLTSGKKMQHTYDMNQDTKKLIKALIYILAFEMLIVIIFYSGLQNLSAATPRLQVINSNSILLCLYYITSFLAFYGLGWLPMFTLLLLINAIRRKKRE